MVALVCGAFLGWFQGDFFFSEGHEASVRAPPGQAGAEQCSEQEGTRKPFGSGRGKAQGETRPVSPFPSISFCLFPVLFF